MSKIAGKFEMNKNEYIERLVQFMMPVLNSSPGAIRIADCDGNTVYTNPAYDQLQEETNKDVIQDAAPVIWHNMPIGSITTYRDVTEENRLQRELDLLQRQLLQIKSMHEARTGITSTPTIPEPSKAETPKEKKASEGKPVKLKDAMVKAERAIIEASIARNNGDKKKAAKELGVPLRTLYYRCEKVGMQSK